MTQLKVPAARTIERLALSNKPTVIITDKLQQQIDFLHAKVGTAEWSGELITREEKSITDLGDWKIICEDIWLADIGSPGFTGYEVDKGGFKAVDIVDMYEAYPGLLDGTLKAHHIHTHHNMGAFFSGTDESQLEDRGSQSNYFMMLVVDFKKTYKAKVAFPAEIKGGTATEIHFANNSDGLEPMKMGGEKERSVLVVMECDVKFETPENRVDEAFKARYTSVKEAITAEEEAKKARTWGNSFQSGYGGYGTGSRSYASGYQLNLRGREDDAPGSTFRKGTDINNEEDVRNAFDTYNSSVRGTKGKTVKGSSAINKGKKGKGGRKGSPKSNSKRISAMSDKEWQEFERRNMGAIVETFELRHATAIINSIIDRDAGINFSPVSNRLYNVDWELKTPQKKEEWVEGFIGSVPDYLELLYPEKCTEEDQLEMLQKLAELLQPYKYLTIVRLMMDALTDELIDLYESLSEEEEEHKLAIEEAIANDNSMDADEKAALGEATLEVYMENNYNPTGNLMQQEIDYSDNVPLSTSSLQKDMEGTDEVDPLDAMYQFTPEGEANLPSDDDWRGEGEIGGGIKTVIY